MYRLWADAYYLVLSYFNFRPSSRGLSSLNLRRHAYILWKTWCWKSEIIKSLRFDIQRSRWKKKNYSLISIEPQGKLSIELLRFYINAKKMNRVVYLDTHIRQTAKQMCWEDLFDSDYVFTLNPFKITDNSDSNIEYLTDQLTAVFFSLVKTSSSDQMELLLSACINALLNFWNSTILDLLDFLNENRNQALLHKSQDLINPIHRQTIEELENWYYKQTQKSVRTRIAKSVSSINTLKVLTGYSTINIGKELNKGKIIICNLKQGLLSEEASKIIGKLIIALIQTEVKKRELWKRHKPTYLFIDEAHDFITEKVTDILAKERQKWLFLTLAHQHIGQIQNSNIQGGLIANTALKFASRNDGKSQRLMARQLWIKEKEFDELKNFQFYVNNGNLTNPVTRPFKSPKKYINTSSPFYMDKSELKKFFLRTVHESGYYQKLDQSTLENETYNDPFISN